MVRRVGMASVELVEHDDDAARPDEPAPRRRSRRWLLVPALVAVALVGVQLVVAARERSSVAALARVPGVVRPVDEHLEIRWQPEAGAESVLWSGIDHDGALVGLQRGSDESQALVAVDERTGAQVWSTPLAEAHEVARDADQGFSPIGGCVGDPGDADRAVCLVSDAVMAYRQEETVLVPSDLSRLVGVDLSDGSVVDDLQVPGATAFAALPGGAVAVGTPGADGALVVAAVDLRTGREQWRTPVPSTAEPDEGGFVDRSTAIFRTADGLAVVTAGRRITLLDGDGRPAGMGVDASTGFEADPQRGTVAAFSQDERGRQTTTILGDGANLVLAGGLARVSADDGSLPGLVLAADSRVRAYDRATGRERWSVGHGLLGSAVVARGKVYLSTPDGVVAVDGRTGDELWRAPVLPGRTMGDLVTDGRHLLSGQMRPDEPGDVAALNDWPGIGEVVAYRFGDGGEQWRVDLPGTLLGIGSVGHTLLGWGSTAVVLG
ncbi:PQQ-binding-like beta-propeller repeat protein [Cellulomonas sp. ICMP 17802]|uniref:outer membrane protein assembly factor BamB family protein n=1 Tax=Cellulomonas sp. ICMP 17802 TaxID=3239199 RepID=UPI00351AD93B